MGRRSARFSTCRCVWVSFRRRRDWPSRKQLRAHRGKSSDSRRIPRHDALTWSGESRPHQGRIGSTDFECRSGLPGASPRDGISPRAEDEEPAAIFREFGKSRAAYFAGDVDRTCWRSGNVDLSQLLQNAMNWVRGPEPMASITGDGIVEAFAWETEPGYALHLLNYTNPNMKHGALRRSYPIGPQQVRLQVGRERSIKSA